MKSAASTPRKGRSEVTAGSYPENRPYLLPETLGEVTGPVAGLVQLPLRLDWTLDDPAQWRGLARDLAATVSAGPGPPDLGRAIPGPPP